MAISYIPEGSPTVTPYLAVKGVAALIDFLKAVFDAQELDRIVLPDGRIMNAASRIATPSTPRPWPPGRHPSWPRPTCSTATAAARFRTGQATSGGSLHTGKTCRTTRS
jgi:hypothetical protein